MKAGTLTAFRSLIWAFALSNEYFTQHSCKGIRKIANSSRYNVITSIFSVWTPQVPIWGWFILFWFLFLAFQMLGVQTFGEAEFWLALIKLLGLTAFYIFAIIYVSGGLIGQTEPLGFKYWRDPGPFNNHGFRGVAVVFVFCSTVRNARDYPNPSLNIPPRSAAEGLRFQGLR